MCVKTVYYPEFCEKNHSHITQVGFEPIAYFNSTLYSSVIPTRPPRLPSCGRQFKYRFSLTLLESQTTLIVMLIWFSPRTLLGSSPRLCPSDLGLWLWGHGPHWFYPIVWREELAKMSDGKTCSSDHLVVEMPRERLEELLDPLADLFRRRARNLPETRDPQTWALHEVNLIQKIPHAKRLRQFRPIAVVPTLYKI